MKFLQIHVHFQVSVQFSKDKKKENGAAKNFLGKKRNEKTPVEVLRWLHIQHPIQPPGPPMKLRSGWMACLGSGAGADPEETDS